MRLTLVLITWLVAAAAHAQPFLIRGKITDVQTGKGIEDARILLTGNNNITLSETVSDKWGYYRLTYNPAVSNGLPLTVLVNHVSYQQGTAFNVSAGQPETILDFQLEDLVKITDEVVVAATRAKEKSPTTYTNVSKKDLESTNLGQDLPMQLGLIPGAVVNSDAGAGVGYTGIRIRGVDPTRINVTVNGIPVNDAESQGVFWVNMPDFATSVDNIQVQRGVGSSTNGAGAFGASINLQTAKIRRQGFAEVSNAVGSFNTIKNNVMFGTGLLQNNWSFEGRLSRITSDGFIDRANANLSSYYLSAAHYGSKSTLKFNVFSGKEVTFQAWDGIPEPKVKGDNAQLQPYIDNLEISGKDLSNLLNSNNRSYNKFLYKNETDNYQQTHYQAHYSHSLSSRWLGNVSLHYTRGLGYFEQYRQGEKLKNYGLQPVISGGDTITATDLVRRRWLDNHFYGTVFSAVYNDMKKVNLTIGGGYNIYQGKHYGEIIWARFASNSENDTRYYDNDARKTDFNIYTKLDYKFTSKLEGFADLQYRNIQYRFLGFDNALNNIQQETNFNFVNPKLGLVYSLNQQSHVYASFSMANREPVRDDFTSSTPATRPQAEQLQNVEAGYRLEKSKFNFTANAYLMNYHNQLILTGKINDVGAYTRVNVPESYRAGIEVTGAVFISKYVQWNGNAALSVNKIKSFSEFVDDWDNGGQVQYNYNNTDLAFSPAVVAASVFRFVPFANTYADVVNKYVSSQYLDNTQSANRKLDAFFITDLRFGYSYKTAGYFKEVRVNALVNNVLGPGRNGNSVFDRLFNTTYEPNGYTFSAMISGQRQDFNYLFPQAGRNFLAQLTLVF